MSIAIDIEQILAELKRIARDAQQFPAADDVRVSEGGQTPAVSSFRRSVSQVASGMGVATQNSIDALNEVGESIRQAVMELAEQDAALADETNTIIALLDSAAEQSTARTAPTPAGTSAPAGATGGTEESTEPEEADY